jgi:SAM-dependent methyltransferase
MSEGSSPPFALGSPMRENELCPDDLLTGQEEAFARDIARLHRRWKEFVNVACPACAGERRTFAYEKFGFAFQRCLVCGTLYMSPRPSEAVITDYYANSENYAYWAEHIFPASERARREKVQKPWLERVLQYCGQFHIPTRTLLEVGAGFGTFCSVAIDSRQFQRVLAVEPTPQMAAACRARGVEVIEKRIEEAIDDIADVDVVCAFEVIEHLFEPRRFIAGIRPLLSAGGLLVLSCPNGEGFDIEMLGPNSLAVDAEHLNLFNLRSLAGLLQSLKFEVLTAHTPGRLDAEFVRAGALKGDVKLDCFLQRILIDDWERLGWPFQQFLAEHGLSSHMWLAARRADG